MDAVLIADKINYKDILYYDKIEIERNAVTFITGESGSGKSTLLKLFSGMVSPDSGDIFYNGDNISDMNTVTLRREVLLCSQTVYLFDGDIKSCFDEYYSYRGLAAPDEQTIKRYMDICQINLPLDIKTTDMSGGERQRVFIAICLSFMPKVLMLDEPTSALDSQTANALMNSICKFCRDNSMTLIVISHDTELCKEFCDREINLKKRSIQ